MDVGMQLIFASSGFDCDDTETFQQELKMAHLAEDLGFDVLWPVEHHFFDYSWCPDNLQLLSYLAAATKRIDLGTAAVIMPWNEPLRVAEKVSVLISPGNPPSMVKAAGVLNLSSGKRSAPRPTSSSGVNPTLTGPW